MKAVILAGGFGTRLSEETDRIPKPMVEIGGRPILWHIMKSYSAHGINDFVICLGYKGYIIKEYFANYYLHMSDITIDVQNGAMEVHESKSEPWRITLADTGDATQTGGRLRRVSRYLEEDETFCLTYGDGLSDVDIGASIEFHRSHGALATVTAVTPPGRWGALRLSEDRVVGFSEKVHASSESLINGGYFVLDKGVIDYIDGDETVWEKQPMEALTKQGQLRPFVHDGFWQAMDTLREKRLLEDIWNAGHPPWKVWS